MRKLLSYMLSGTMGIMVFAGALISQNAWAEDPTYDVTGNYVFSFEHLGSNHLHDVELDQDAFGALTGAGGYPAGGSYTYEWEITSGSVSGESITFTADYTAGADAVTPLTTMEVTGTIAGDGTISGTWSDNYQGGERSGTFETTEGEATLVTSNMVIVSGDTSAGENLPGWMFNRDAGTGTPFEFNTDQASIGTGSLYVEPIGSTAVDKFIAENFINEPIADVGYISYDFMIGEGGDEADAEQFYMNVYANFGASDDLNFYDCRYDVVPTTGSTTDWTTVIFDPTQEYPVTESGSSPMTCPASPAEMEDLSAGSNIRAFAINVGDTSTSDEGLSGYLDNVVVFTDSNVTTYDFEPEGTDITAPAVPIHISPADGDTLTTEELDKIDWTDAIDDSSETVTYFYEVSNSPDVMEDGSFVSVIFTSGELTESEIATPNTPEGTYYWHVRAVDDVSNASDWSNPWSFTIDNDGEEEPTVPLTKDECKDGGWMTFSNPSFKNQGQCVAYVATRQNQQQ